MTDQQDRQDARRWSAFKTEHWGLLLIVAGFGIQLLLFSPDQPVWAVPVGIVLAGAGIAILAKKRNKPMWYGLVALWPLLGPLIGIISLRKEQMR